MADDRLTAGLLAIGLPIENIAIVTATLLA